MVTDDAYVLFTKYYGELKRDQDIKILRQEILEDLLNNNPLAIKLVTKSRTRLRFIEELRDQLKAHFFESLNEVYDQVFKNNADLNIERTKSIYQSINYSYTTLNSREKIAFELLSLFPDGISLGNFKKCFIKSTSANSISDRELRVIRDKSLVEDYNGVLQLQPIIRRFADYQFNLRPSQSKQKYCRDAYLFNGFVLRLIDNINSLNSFSASLRFFNNYKNNLLNALSYFPYIELEEGKLEKNYLLNYVYKLEEFIVTEKQIREFHEKMEQLHSFFSDMPFAETLIKVLDYNKTYYYHEFDNSYKMLSKIMSIEDISIRDFSKEDYVEKRYKNIISNIYSMEGYTWKCLESFIDNDSTDIFFESYFFYLGIIYEIIQKKEGFYHFEYKLMLDKLNIESLEQYIDSLYSEERLEIMQCTYTLSKVKKLDIRTIKKLVVTNPYTRGLKELMFAFITNDPIKKLDHFELALKNLEHIKYYYLEALYYYCIFLKAIDNREYENKLEMGLELTSKFYYQYLNHLFKNLSSGSTSVYDFSYSFYLKPNLSDYVQKHKERWEKRFQEEQLP